MTLDLYLGKYSTYENKIVSISLLIENDISPYAIYSQNEVSRIYLVQQPCLVLPIKMLNGFRVRRDF